VKHFDNILLNNTFVCNFNNNINCCCDISEFIKKGTNAAVIEIMLTNKGDTAYKPEIYGDMITVMRTIGSTNSYSYKIKNWRGM